MKKKQGVQATERKKVCTGNSPEHSMIRLRKSAKSSGRAVATERAHRGFTLGATHLGLKLLLQNGI